MPNKKFNTQSNSPKSTMRNIATNTNTSKAPAPSSKPSSNTNVENSKGLPDSATLDE